MDAEKIRNIHRRIGGMLNKVIKDVVSGNYNANVRNYEYEILRDWVQQGLCVIEDIKVKLGDD